MDVNNSMDQYEKQLFSLFTSYDSSHNGNLTKEALHDLCSALQLEDRGRQLIKLLCKDAEKCDISFREFRDGLLTVLGDENCDQPGFKRDQNENHSEGDSSGRELSPKYVFGSKKYGRRSRPTFKLDSLDLISDNSTRINDMNSTNNEKKSSKVRRSISLNEGSRNDYFGINSLDVTHLSVTRVENIECTSNSPFSTLDCNSNTQETLHHANMTTLKLQAGDSIEAIADQEMDDVNSIEDSVPTENIIELWESVGIVKPQQLLQDLGFQNRNLKLSQIICVLEDEIKMMINSLQETLTSHPLIVLFQAVLCLYRCETKTLKLCLNHTVAERKKLKSDLTDANQRAMLLAHEVDENHVNMENVMKQNIKQLETKHAEAVKEMMEDHATEKELSSLTISKLEHRLLSLEADETKLKSQLSTLQDDNSKLEKELNKSQEQLFELTDIKNYLTKELKVLGNERQKVQTNIGDEKILLLENQLAKYQSENIALKDKNDELCAELDNLKSQSNQLKVFENHEESHLNSYGIQMNPMNSLSSSNDTSSSLNSQIDLLKIGDGKDSCDFAREDVLTVDPTDVVESCEQFDENSSTECTPADGGNFLNVLINVDDQMVQRTKKLLEFVKNASYDQSEDVLNNNLKPYIICMYAIIKRIIFNLNSSLKVNQDGDNVPELGLSAIIHNIVGEILECSYDNSNQDKITNISFKYTDNNTSSCNCHERFKQIDNIASLKNQLDSLNECLKKERDDRMEERIKDNEKYQELESNMELLRNEYFKCEEYWSTKLNEEREIFDQEQRITDEKFTELLTKLSEYEEQFTGQDNKSGRFDGPLSTIEEKCHLEKQFNDLEDEFQEYKLKAEDEIRNKDLEISGLKERISTLDESIKNIVNNNKNQNDFATITNNEDKIKNNDSFINNNTKHLINDKDSYVDSPINYLWTQKTIPSPLTSIKSNAESQRDYQNPAYVKDNPNENPNGTPVINPIQKPSSVKTNAAETSRITHDINDVKNGFDSKPEAKMLNCSDLEEALQGRRKRIQQTDDGHSTAQSQNNSTILRTVALEIHCRQLQAALRQQQAYAESVFQQTVAAHRVEIGALKQRLAAADLLVHDLYVNNCHLASNMNNPLFK